MKEETVLKIIVFGDKCIRKDTIFYLKYGVFLCIIELKISYLIHYSYCFLLILNYFIFIKTKIIPYKNKGVIFYYKLITLNSLFL